ncbi:MAG: hypothetical protein JXR96_23410 [Deltaproteobacteria bacterium]|nr:hypothetical protein [Deltaproteobacteria bacterium]
MYELRPDIKVIQTARENIVAIIESINTPYVAASGRPSEQSKAYIIGMRNASGLFSVYVYLHLIDSHDCLVYLHDPSEVPMESYHDTELEALGFVESMGFMVDNLNFRSLSPEQQIETMRSLPLFHADLQAFSKAHGGAEQETETEDEAVDLSPLEGDVLELGEVAEVVTEKPSAAPVIPLEGLARIVRMLSSF